jgi:hypothetical protein
VVWWILERFYLSCAKLGHHRFSYDLNRRLCTHFHFFAGGAFLLIPSHTSFVSLPYIFIIYSVEICFCFILVKVEVLSILLITVCVGYSFIYALWLFIGMWKNISKTISIVFSIVFWFNIKAVTWFCLEFLFLRTFIE